MDKPVKYTNLEEVVGELVGQVLVPAGDGVAAQAEHDPVHAAKVVHVGRVVELLVQLHEEGHLAELLIAAAHAEGGGCNVVSYQYHTVQTGDKKRRPGNRIEGATGCPSWCRPLRPLFHFPDDVSYSQSVVVFAGL